MKVAYLSPEWVEVIPENSKETASLIKFPAFSRRGPRMIFANKHLIVKNLVTRLRAKYPKVLIDTRLADMVATPLKLLELPSWFSYHTSPKKHQDICLRYLWTLRNAGLLLAPGMGKTKIYLDFIYLIQSQRSAVICPKALLFTWEDEIATHRPELTSHTVSSTDWHAELPGILEKQVSIFNYDKAVRLSAGIQEVKWGSMNIDEGLIKDPTTERTRALTEISREVPNRVLNSGTLINNSPLDMFAPVRYLEPTLVGTSFSAFREVYAVVKKMKDTKREVVVAYRGVPEMRDTLESCCIVMSKEEWLDLPSKTFTVVEVQASAEQCRVYDQLQSNYAAEVQGKIVEVPSPLVLAAKQMQVANGFIYYVEGGGITREEISDYSVAAFFSKSEECKPKAKREILYFEDQPKLRKLLEMLQNQLSARRVMVWYNLQAERKLIEEALSAAGISFLTIAGGEKDTGGKVRGFNRDSTVQVLLCQAKAVNYGVTVLGTKLEAEPEQVMGSLDSQVFTQIFYSLNFSLEVFLQQQDRIHRIGQDMPCEYYVLLSTLDVEPYVYKVLGEKESVKNSMMVDFVNSRAVEV